MRASARRASRGSAQDHHRDLAVAPALVAVVVGVERDQLRPEARSLFLVCRARDAWALLAADLDLHFGIGLQVLVPERVLGPAALRCDDRVIVAVAQVDERDRA